MNISTSTLELKDFVEPCLINGNYKSYLNATDLDSQTSYLEKQPFCPEASLSSARSLIQRINIVFLPQVKSKLAYESSEGACDWLQKAVELEKNGEVDDALDLVFEKVDNYLKEGKFELIDNLISEIDTRKFTPDVLLTLLTVSYSAINELSNWGILLNKVHGFYRAKDFLTESLDTWFLSFNNA